MRIISESTPNPQVLKFLPGVAVTNEGRKVIRGESFAPAAALFEADAAINEVYFGRDFVAVTKVPDASWETLRPLLLATLAEMAEAGVFPLTVKEAKALPGGEIETLIEEVLASHIRPAVAADGGNIVLDRFENGIAYVRMQGACSGCPSAGLTLRDGVENTLRHFVPQVQEVQAV